MVCAMLLVACTDTFPFGEERGEGIDGNIQFGVSTREMGDLMIGIGSTRAAVSPESREADAFTARDMEGENPCGLSLHRMPLPFVGIHSKAVHASANAETRASVDDIASTTNFHDSLSIWGYTNKGTDDKGIELFNATLLKQIQNWRSAVQWPYEKAAASSSTTMRFYAIAPSVENLNFTEVKGNNDAGASYERAPVFKLTLPESVADMRDVLYGESEIISVQAGPSGSVTNDPESENIGQDNKKIPLKFNHIMTAIRFAQGGTFPANVTINRITLKNIYASGTFNPGEKDEFTGTSGDWKIESGTGALKYDYTLTNLSTSTSGSNTYIDGQQVLFMIPHTLTEEAELEVELTAPKQFETDGETDGDGNYKLDGNGNRQPYTGTNRQTHIVSCKLKGDIWKKGYTVTYRLTIGKLEDGYYLFAESPEALEHSKSLMKGTFTVHSYRSYYDYSDNPLGTEDTTHEVNWKIVGYADREKGEDFTIGKMPEWLTITKPDDNNASASFELAPAEPKEKLKHSSVLSDNSNPPAELQDLSEQGTANCYIVDRKGTYSFPLVYGNKTGGDGDKPEPEPAGIVDHRGAIISYKSIQDQMKYVHKWGDDYKLQAEIVWQDVAGFISVESVLKGGDGAIGSIQFIVKEAVPANAVIALKGCPTGADSGSWETLWTWHIWMTDEVKSVELENFDDKTKTNSILPVNLGWKPDPDKDEFGVYEPREVWVKIAQVESKKGTPASTVICIKQHARQDFVTGTSTIYQWGRPTALPMTVVDSEGKTRPIYDKSGNDISSNFSFTTDKGVSLGYHIANPYKMYQWDETKEGQSVWFDKEVVTVPEYWSADKKTVYDPCPPGYQVPPVAVFNVLSRTGSSSPYGSQLNVYPDVDGQSNVSPNAGGYFYTRKFVSEEDMDIHRYSPLVYFPVTGNWQGEKNNAECGIYWCADYNSTNKTTASALWIRPEWGYMGTDAKPAIQFGLIMPYSSAQPIRPMMAH